MSMDHKRINIFQIAQGLARGPNHQRQDNKEIIKTILTETQSNNKNSSDNSLLWHLTTYFGAPKMISKH